jgi:hypothetical protein
MLYMEKIMLRWKIALFAQVLLALTCLQLVSGCIFVPVGDDRGRGGHDRGFERDRHDEHRR